MPEQPNICGDCVHFVPSVKPGGEPLVNNEGRPIGCCYAHPPTPVGTIIPIPTGPASVEFRYEGRTVYPQMADTHRGCGEYGQAQRPPVERPAPGEAKAAAPAPVPPRIVIANGPLPKC